ncbi:MAG: hypothetical protein AAFV88_18950 [Planctomycetota bacterium]
MLILAVAAFIGLSKDKTNLSQNEYDITMALYRVCNQQSTEGLRKVSEILDGSLITSSSPSEGLERLKSIIRLADEGAWQNARRQCRQLLEEQVER